MTVLPVFNLENLENIYIVAISKNENLFSMRDLTGDHIKLLKSMKKETVIEEFLI